MNKSPCPFPRIALSSSKRAITFYLYPFTAVLSRPYFLRVPAHLMKDIHSIPFNSFDTFGHTGEYEHCEHYEAHVLS